MVKDEDMLEELKKIRMLLETKPPPPPPKGMWAEFKAFLENYKVLGLAVAFIMGLYLGNLVQSLVQDLLLPAIGLAIPRRQLLSVLDNFHHRCLRDLYHREGDEEVGYKVAG